MSITFTPLAGTWTSFSYYPADGIDEPDAVNGMIRFENEEPSVQCHNSGGYRILEELGFESDSCGGATDVQAADALSILVSQRERFYRDDYLRHKYAPLETMLRHCIYHGCGFSWG